MKNNWKYIEPTYSPFFGFYGDNYVYHIGKSYFSYNENPNNNIIDEMFGENGGEETAFYNAKKDSFIILYGDFRKEIDERGIKTLKQAIEFCKEKYPKYGGSMTTDTDFNELFS